MASAYAALVSLVHVLNRVQHPTCAASFEKLRIPSLLHKVNSLLSFLDSYSQPLYDVLATKMFLSACAIEDIVESYIADQLLEKRLNKEGKIKKQKILEISSSDAYVLMCQDLEKSIQEMDIMMQEAMEFIKVRNNQLLRCVAIHVDSSIPRNETIRIAGYDEELRRLMDQLTTHHTSRRIVPVVGMGGIGKTTLAKNVYNHPHFKKYFDLKAWVTITQDFTSEIVTRAILRDIGVGNVNHICDSELGDQLYQQLHGRKYLLILDDIWDTKAWTEINRFCPDNSNGSRILVTTRILDVGRNIGSCSVFNVKLLDDDQSWDLLSKKVFGEETCPPELKECGMKISTSCKGLPLTIVVISGLLKMSEKTQEYWDEVAENINSIISSEDGEHCMKVLSLSYQQLPIHLKPCFLYLASYPRGYDIRISELIMLWAADGFLKPNVGSNNTLEEVASKYLNDLINRNLVIVKKFSCRGEMKRLTIHDLVIDLCMREVQKERFLHFDYGDAESSENNENPRRLVFRGSNFTGMQSKVSLRSYISFEHDSPRYLSQLSFLRVCVVCTTCKIEDLMQLVNLRLLRLSVYDYDLSMFSEITMLSNLETLIVVDIPNGYNVILDIWHLRHIKHLIVSDMFMLLDPPTADADFVLQNLRTLETVHIWSDKMLDMIPNIKKLRIHYEHHEDAELLHGFGNLAACHKLENLKISSSNCRELKAIRFPNSLRKLTLSRTDIPWQSCHLGALPNLEAFKLYCCNFDDGKWDTIEGEFQSLKFLLIEGCYLKTWTVDDCSHFPKLERLSLRFMRQLHEIPDVFGESTTLEWITLDNCLKPAVLSAKQILEEQQIQGNENFAVHIIQNSRGQPNANELNEFLRSIGTDDNIHVRFR